MALLKCGNCHNEIPHGVHGYTMKVEMYPRVEESLEFSEVDLQKDINAELQAIVEQLEAMSDQEVELEEERVYSCFKFVLCRECRDALATGFRRSLHAPEDPGTLR